MCLIAYPEVVSETVAVQQIVHHLIQEDLKCRKFFGGLRELGLDDAIYQPDLASLILTLTGFDTECDQHYDLYYHLAEECVPEVVKDPEVMRRLAERVYGRLTSTSSGLRPPSPQGEGNRV